MGEILKFPRLENDKQRVCAYVRISRKTGRVEDSFTYQSAYWTGKLGQNPRYNFLGVFGDEGVSDRKTRQRKQFLKMLELAYNGYVDIIYVKSVQKFGRHIEDCIDAINKLKAKCVRVIFESDNIARACWAKILL